MAKLDQNPKSNDEQRFLSNDDQKTSLVERLFEGALWSSRYIVLLAVISSVLVSLGLFIIGTVDIAKSLIEIFKVYVLGDHALDLHITTLSDVIGAIDIYLIAVVLLIFAFGLYELFISRIDPARQSETSNILDIHSLEELKHKLAQVIIMALIVKFFQLVLVIKVADLITLAVLAGCILGLSLAVYFMRKPHDNDVPGGK